MPAQPPAHHHAPIEIAPDTFLIQQLLGEGEAPVAVPVNSMIIRGAEPIVIDTGGQNNRENWLADAWSIVDPADVRWVFLSHDDVDHTGNLEQVLDACPNATLVTTFFMGERMSVDLDPPLHRARWINDGDGVDVGDRQLVAMRPPIFDSPVTRGFLDTKTGLYWGADTFATPVLEHATHVDEIDQEFWEAGVLQFARMVSPWFELVDETKWHNVISRFEAAPITSLAGCHTPVVTGERVGRSFELLHHLAGMEAFPDPTQADLDAMLAAASAMVA